MKPRKILLAAVALASAALASSASGAADSPEDALPLTELMGHLFQRNAFQLWAWTAVESNQVGEHSGEPKTVEDWEDAESDALTLRHLAVVLRSAPYRVDDPRWDKLAQGLQSAATASAEAAESRDLVRFTAAGEALNASCVACHWAFAPDLEAVPPPVEIP